MENFIGIKAITWRIVVVEEEVRVTLKDHFKGVENEDIEKNVEVRSLEGPEKCNYFI